MDSDSFFIRQYKPTDLDDLYNVCLKTADNGEDGTQLFRDPRLPGDVYLAPYVTLGPSLAFVAQDAEGVAGYIVAALDSRAFDQWLEDDWMPKLRVRYPEPSPEVAAALSALEQDALVNIYHRWDTADELATRFPSHMHIDLLPRVQARGIGRKLVDALVGRLRDQGSPGLHLIVGDGNPKAVGFYRHVGFAEVPAERLYPVTGLHVFVMDLRA